MKINKFIEAAEMVDDPLLQPTNNRVGDIQLTSIYNNLLNLLHLL